MAETLSKFEPVINEPLDNKHTASVIFLHGSGGTGVSLQDRFQNEAGIKFYFPHIKVIFPTAPMRPLTRTGTQEHVWFDRYSLEPSEVESVSTIDSMAQELSEMIDIEVRSGIPKHRIIVAGYSMGGCMTLHLGIRFQRDLAGIVSLSNFLYRDSEVFKVLAEEKPQKLPPVLMCHGDKDDLILYDWALETKEHLNKLGVNVNFHTIQGMEHELGKQALDLIWSWIMKILPDDQ